MPFGPWPGVGSGGGGGGGLFLDYMERAGDEFLIINNADWSVNANAPGETDSINNAYKNARYDNGSSTGRGYRRRITATTGNVKLLFQLRGDGTATNDTDFELHYRRMTQNPPAAVPAWKILTLAGMAIAADVFYDDYSETFVVGGGAGQIDVALDEPYEFEIVRLGGSDAYAGIVRLGMFAMAQLV